MTLWLDAHLSPALARFLADEMEVEAVALLTMGLDKTPDTQVLLLGRARDVVILSKDADFPQLLERHGPPPRVIWLRCGNRPNSAMKELLREALPSALLRIAQGEPLVEIG